MIMHNYLTFIKAVLEKNIKDLLKRKYNLDTER